MYGTGDFKNVPVEHVFPVDLVGQKWNQLLKDTKDCAAFMRELKEAEEGDELRAA